MGVIKRQSLKFTLVNMIGTMIGFLSVVLIYPLDKEAYGFFQFLYNSASLLVPFLGLGVFAYTVRYAPQFSLKNIKPYLLSFVLKYLLGSVIIMTLLGIVLLKLLHFDISNILPNIDAINNNIIWIYLLAIMLLLISVLSAVAASYYRIVIPDILNTLMLKFSLPIAILLVSYGTLTKDSLSWLSVVYYGIIVSIIFVYINTLDNHKWGNVFNRFSKIEYMDMLKYITFISLNGLGASLALKLDVSMIGSMLTVAAVGTFSLVMTISNVIDIPTKALAQISSPIIADSWAINDTRNIQNIFTKSSLYGEIIGVFFFLLIYSLWGEILAIMPGDKGGLNFSLATQLFFYLGLGRLINISTGVNSLIIAFSKDYKYQLYFLIILGISNVLLNYYLIKSHGIVGAAMATCIALIVFNASQNGFIYFKYGFGLDFKNMAKVMVIGLVLYFGLDLLKFPFHAIINMVLKSTVITLIYVSIIWWVNPGGELRSEGLKSLASLKAKLPVSVGQYIAKIITFLQK